MKYYATAAMFLAAFVQGSSSRTNAQDNPPKKEVVREIVVNQPPAQAKVQERGPEVYHFTIAPAAEPVPALKYRLFPSRVDLKPGNSVPFYYRAVLGFTSLPKKTLEQLDGLLEELENKPFSEFDSAKLREKYCDPNSFSGGVDQLETAVFREETNWDWQFNQLTGTKPIEFLLPEMQEARGLARLLSVKTRFNAADGNLDAALAGTTMMFKMSQDLAKPPTIINNLVGVAIASIASANIRDIIGQTDCPNLYWALASLPDPLIDMRVGLEQEAGLVGMMFPFLKHPEEEQHSPEEWARLIREAYSTMQKAELSPNRADEPTGLAAAALIVRGYPVAKRELIAAGMDRKTVEQMPVGQAVAIYQHRITQYVYDEMFKWTYLPHLQRVSGMKSTQERIQNDGYFNSNGFREVIPMAALLMPAVRQAMQAEVRVSAKIKGLMVLEAIRMHMAANGGRLPDSLDDITVVPLPVCPATGEPYPYHKEDGGAVLTINADPDVKPVWWEIHLKTK